MMNVVSSPNDPYVTGIHNPLVSYSKEINEHMTDTMYSSIVDSNENTPISLSSNHHDSGITFSSNEIQQSDIELKEGYELINKEQQSQSLFKCINPDSVKMDELASISSEKDLSMHQDQLKFVTSDLSDSMVILSSSHDQSLNSSRKISSSSATSELSIQNGVDSKFIRKLIDDAYEASKNGQACMEYDESWQPCAESSPSKQQILFRDLSFDDDLKDIQGIDLMAPVFLAVTDDVDDNHVKDLRRKAKSIEDLCSTDYHYLYGSLSRERSKSELFLSKYHTKRNKTKSQDTNFHEEEDNIDDIKHRLLSSAMSNISEEFPPLSSVSDQYNESIDDSLEDDAIIEVFINNGMYDDSMMTDPDMSSFDMLKEMNNSSMFAEQRDATSDTSSNLTDVVSDEQKEMKRPASLQLFEDEGDLRMTPTDFSGSTSGFWEYPFNDSPSTPTPQQLPHSREESINTSPSSVLRAASLKDRFVVVNVTGQQRIVDMKLIEPYLKALTHGGHHSDGDERHVLIVFSACYLPCKTIEKYNIIMEQLFYYFVHAVDLLVADTYEIIFFNSLIDGNNMPERSWIKQCYHMVDYRLKKNLRKIYFVHQSLWLKAALRFSTLFVSSKFRRKIQIVRNISALKQFVPMDYIFMPPEIYNADKKFS